MKRLARGGEGPRNQRRGGGMPCRDPRSMTQVDPSSHEVLPTAQRKAASASGPALSFLIAAWTSAGIPKPLGEYRFAPPRRFRFDWAWPHAMVAVEIDGGAFSGDRRCPTCKQSFAGRHTRGAGFVKDIEKHNLAIKCGWKVLRCVPSDATSTRFIELLRTMVDRGWRATDDPTGNSGSHRPHRAGPDVPAEHPLNRRAVVYPQAHAKVEES